MQPRLLFFTLHQIHIAIPVNALLDAGIDPKEIPLPHEWLMNTILLSQLYPSFNIGLFPFFTLKWEIYKDFLTFQGRLNPITGGLWLTDQAHHHLAISILFFISGHIYRTNWKIGHFIHAILEAHQGSLTAGGHRGLYEILINSWHAQLSINLALFGSTSIIVSHHIYSIPPYPYVAIDYRAQLSLFTHHIWIGSLCIVGSRTHAAIFIIRDYDISNSYNSGSLPAV